MLKRVIVFSLLLLALMGVSSRQTAAAQSGSPLVIVLTAEGPVGPPMVAYVARSIDLAEQRQADLIVIQLDTPGGLSNSMLEIVQRIRGSRVPVVVYVSPRGGMAASAGAVITMAGHAAAMAPETTIGAASPVGSQGEDLGETMKSKVVEDMKATVRSLTTNRPPEAIALAEAMIEKARAVTSQEALAIGLIDFIADDLDDLLNQLNGFMVETADGQHVLHTTNAVLNPMGLLFIEQLLQILTNPNVVFLLITIGVQAILIELSSPGGWIAGFIGVVCLALATYGLGMLPVNWFGIVFLATAFVLFVLDIKAPTHGALTVAGIGSLIVGALVLFNSPGTPQFQRVSVPLVVIVALATAAFFGTILTFALRAQKKPVRTGQESLIGRVGVTRSALTPRGSVQLGGELWSAELVDAIQSGESLPPGTRVEVVRVDGIRLIVRRASTD